MKEASSIRLSAITSQNDRDHCFQGSVEAQDMSRYRNRRGFTLKELIVVSFITLLAGGLLWPALEASRSVGRSHTCRNNLRNMTLATIYFEKAKQQYPGYANSIRGNDRSWTFVLLPQLERMDLYEPFIAANTPQPTQEMDVVQCPTLTDAQRKTLGTPRNSYIANTGLPDFAPASRSGLPADWLANGVFHDLRDLFDSAGDPLPKSIMTATYIAAHDGTSNTILLSESLDARSWVLVGATNYERQMGFVWSPQVGGNPSRPTPPPSLRINAGIGGDPTWTSINHARPSSAHPGLVNVSFCDGHVRTMSDKIDYRVFCQLMTPRGDRARFPGAKLADEESLDDPAYVDRLFRQPLTQAELEAW